MIFHVSQECRRFLVVCWRNDQHILYRAQFADFLEEFRRGLKAGLKGLKLFATERIIKVESQKFIVRHGCKNNVVQFISYRVELKIWFKSCTVIGLRSFSWYILSPKARKKEALQKFAKSLQKFGIVRNFT